MKKTIFTLLALLVCTIQPTTAYEYFTIYFSDGTKSQAFYATDVDSICYSKLDLDSIAYDDWQVQEIYTCDSVYRYPLAQIDSLSFKDVDVNKVAKYISNISTRIAPLFAASSSMKELENNLEDIAAFSGVEDVWTDNQSLFVKIQDWGAMTFSYYPKMNMHQTARFQYRMASQIADDTNLSKYKACIVNPLYNDGIHGRALQAADSLQKSFNVMGIQCQPVNNPLPEFFSKEIFDYDLIFLITHGNYDSHSKAHWLITSERLFDFEDVEDINT